MKVHVDEALKNASIKLSAKSITVRYIPSPGRILKLREEGAEPSLLLIVEKNGRPAVVKTSPIKDFTPVEFTVPAPEPPYELQLLLTISP